MRILWYGLCRNLRISDYVGPKLCMWGQMLYILSKQGIIVTIRHIFPWPSKSESSPKCKPGRAHGLHSLCSYHTACRVRTRPVAAACALQIIAAASASLAWSQIQQKADAAAAAAVATVAAAEVAATAAEAAAGPRSPSRWAGELGHSAGRSAGDRIRPNQPRWGPWCGAC